MGGKIALNFVTAARELPVSGNCSLLFARDQVDIKRLSPESVIARQYSLWRGSNSTHPYSCLHRTSGPRGAASPTARPLRATPPPCVVAHDRDPGLVTPTSPAWVLTHSRLA